MADSGLRNLGNEDSAQRLKPGRDRDFGCENSLTVRASPSRPFASGPRRCHLSALSFYALRESRFEWQMLRYLDKAKTLCLTSKVPIAVDFLAYENRIWLLTLGLPWRVHVGALRPKEENHQFSVKTLAFWRISTTGEPVEPKRRREMVQECSCKNHTNFFMQRFQHSATSIRTASGNSMFQRINGSRSP